MATPVLRDPNLLMSVGINPKTGLPYRMDGANDLQDSFLKLLRIQDEQDYIQKYKWINLPKGLTGEMIERILYYRGQGMFFYMKEVDQFYFLPFTKIGGIDVYGRFKQTTPLPFNGQVDNKEDKKATPWISGLVRNPVYDIMMDVPEEDDIYNSCVILTDYSRQISQTVLPRKDLQEPILAAMSECLPFARTALINSLGITGVRVESADEYPTIVEANNATRQAAIHGNRYVPIEGKLEMQELGESTASKAQDAFLVLQSLDNLRLQMHGLDNGGLFDKKESVLQDEYALNNNKCTRVYENGLDRRQEFALIIDSIWHLDTMCVPGDSTTGGEAMQPEDEQDEMIQSAGGKGEPTGGEEE